MTYNLLLDSSLAKLQRNGDRQFSHNFTINFQPCTAKNAVETAAKTVAEKAGQKVGEVVVEKKSKQIQQLLRKRYPKQATQELANILENQVAPTSSTTMKLNRILANEI